jgi:hypothetical protein
MVRRSDALTRRGFVFLVAGGLVGCGSSGRPTGSSGTLILGQATFPPQLGGGVAANAPVQAFDLTRGGALLFEGRTDASGNYRVDVATSATIYIIVNGLLNGSRVRVSGLLNPAQQGLSKDFNGVTDIACQAGVDAVLGNPGQPPPTISGAQVDARRIQNLESAAGRIAGGVNFFNFSEVLAAATRVRQLTNDGASPPP